MTFEVAMAKGILFELAGLFAVWIILGLILIRLALRYRPDDDGDAPWRESLWMSPDDDDDDDEPNGWWRRGRKK